MLSAVQAQHWSGAASEQNSGMTHSTGLVLLAVTVYIFVMPISHSHAIIATCGWLCYCLFKALDQALPRKLGKADHFARVDASGRDESETASDSSSSNSSSGDERFQRDRTVAAARFHARVLSKVAKRSQHAALRRKIPPPPAEDPPPPPTAVLRQATAMRQSPPEAPPGPPPPKHEEWEVELEWLRECRESGVEMSGDQWAQLQRCEELEERTARIHAERVVQQIGGILLVSPHSEALDDESPEGKGNHEHGVAGTCSEGRCPRPDASSDKSGTPDQWSGEAQGKAPGKGNQEKEEANACFGGSGLGEHGLAEPEVRGAPPPRIAEETAAELSEHDDALCGWARKE